MKKEHILSGINMEHLIAECSKCGPVSLRKSSKMKEGVQCSTKTINWHKMLSRDFETNTGECFLCGPVKLSYRRGCGKIDTERTKLKDEKRVANEDGTYKNTLKFHRGLNVDGYNDMLEKQNGCCAVCRRHHTEFTKRLSVDHDHNCCPYGKSCNNCRRGLLCQNCNAGEGNLFGDPIRMLRMIEYLGFNLEKELERYRNE